ncbi:44467_t:CDS:2 [Gigaspora margarita]|uniref:44467_t:CDS:1 n=1 Tax=Gigaspora margarita TaxID=4874 RepID=A0ABN7VY20_GIGMA|nr:44467_t:CDS:2 [Gigaspora margarita]
MNKSQFDDENFQDENSYNKNSQDKNFQDENSQNENFQDENSQDKSSQCENSQNENFQDSIQKKSAECLPAGVWGFFDKGASIKDHCCSQAVFQKLVPGVELSQKKRKVTSSQALLSEFLESTKLILERENNINLALIKVFIVCNIPFHIISNLYFIDALRELRPGYQPPSRQLLTGRLLTAEIVKINQNIINVLEKSSNLTLGLDGWTNPNEKLLWNFVIHTSSGREYLWKLVDLSNQSHSGEVLQDYIGIKLSQFAQVAGIAGRLWTRIVGSNIKKGDLDILKAQLCKYACNEEPYNGSYVPDINSALSSLAVKLFSVRSHAASCERIWSHCEWFLGDRCTNLGTKNLESMVKISSYLISNAKQELHYYGLDLTEEEIQSIVQDFVVFSEVEEESTSDNLDDLNEIMNYSEPEVEHQNLEIEDLIVLNNFKLDKEGI